MKLEVGMYVRTNEGKITKLIEIDKYGFKRFDKLVDFTNYKIIKASHNIIDLIEVGDYINGYIVLEIIKDNLGKTYIECGCKDEIAHNYIYDTFYEEDIKSIITKEQFSAMEYRLGGK